ncbi:hypothetical protein L6R52_03405 [Myxococcota bacterium]|nr:hypothetical protein [Myxococcota bacterium]
MRLVALAGALALTGLACASEESISTSTVLVSFTISRGGAELSCAEVPEISSLTVAVFGADGISARAGYPRTIDCSNGAISLPGLPEGAHTIELKALGTLAGDDAAVLFRARSTFETPRDLSLALSLRPEVAFVDVAWSFDGSLVPCTTEVRQVEVLVSAGTSQAASYHRRAPCAASPLVVPVPLPLLRVTVQVNAYSAQEFILFSGTVERALERGANTIDVALMPMGNHLYFDWTFALGSQTIRACDDPRVGAASVTATVRSLEGGPEATETFPCETPRPYVFLPQRYRAGRMLEVELVAEGAERFVGRETFTMPAADRFQDPPLVLDAVGTATVAVLVRTSTCGAEIIDGIGVAIWPADAAPGAEPAVATTIPLGQSEAVVEDLPYGEYVVDVAQLRNESRLCSVRERRVIDARASVWEPFVL